MIYTLDQLVKMTGRNAVAVAFTERDPWHGEIWGWDEKRGPVIDQKALPRLKDALWRVPMNAGKPRRFRGVRAKGPRLDRGPPLRMGATWI